MRIVSIGGGTGLSSLLRGLKNHPGNLSVIVTVTDDGGSSGRLRRDFDVLPPGDIRNCMVALSQDETLLARLFNYRFSGGRGLKGHSFGNLFLTAMTHLTGDFPQAVKLSAEVLAVAGRIYPSPGANVSLEAPLADGTIVSGSSVESYRSWAVWVERSTDNGRTWTRFGPITVPGTDYLRKVFGIHASPTLDPVHQEAEPEAKAAE